MANKPKTQIEIVNVLVRMSFGRGFSGDGIIFSNHSGDYMVKSDRLESIARRKGLYIPNLIENYEKAGEFLSENSSNPDGSILKINQEYLNRAERYATLYELHFHKPVSIKFNELKE